MARRLQIALYPILANVAVGLVASNANAQQYVFGETVDQAKARAIENGLELKPVPGSDSFIIYRRENGKYQFAGGLSFCKGRLYEQSWPLSGGYEGLARTVADLNAKNGPGISSARSEYLADGLLSGLDVTWKKSDGFEERVTSLNVTGSRTTNSDMSLSRHLSAKAVICR